MPSISRIANGEKTGKMDREKEEGRKGEGQKRESNGRCEAKTVFPVSSPHFGLSRVGR